MFRLVILVGLVLAVIPRTRPILIQTLFGVGRALVIPLIVVWGSSSRR